MEELKSYDKYNKLIEAIENSSLDKFKKLFLKHMAMRRIPFDYEVIDYLRNMKSIKVKPRKVNKNEHS